jgi:hypothetical protein
MRARPVLAAALLAGLAARGSAQEPPPPPDERPRTPVAPGDGLEPRPPRAVAPPPHGPPGPPPWPADLTRRTSLGVNLLGFVPGPEEGALGTWRVEGVLERALRPRLGAAAIVSGGQVRKDGHDDATSAGLSAQFRWYAAGRFDRGVYLAGTLGFWILDPHVAWSLGGGVGYKRTFPGGFTLDLLAGLQLPVDEFRSSSGGNPPALDDAWRALLPGPLVSLGYSFVDPSTLPPKPRR